MVIEEIQISHKNKTKREINSVEERGQHSSDLFLASPIDRLAAHIADAVLFVPLSSIGLALFKNQMLLSRVLGQQLQLQALLASYFLFFLFLFVVFQTAFLFFVQATPGKYFFGLIVEDVWKRKLSLYQCFLRSILWLVDLFLFIPLLGVFLNSKRRPLHDRLSDTIVLSRRRSAVPYLSRFEVFAGRTLSVFFICFLVSVVFVVGLKNADRLLFLSEQARGWATGYSYCKELNVESSLRNSKRSHRLELALGLFSAGALAEECLEKEADAVLWDSRSNKEELAQANLAKAFAIKDKSGKADSYLQEVCEHAPKAEECLLTQVFQKMNSEDKGRSVAEKLQSDNKQLSAHSVVWLTRYFYQLGETNKSLLLLEQLPKTAGFEDFSMEYQVKLAWRNNQAEQAAKIYEIYQKNTLVKEHALQLGTWLCTQQIAKDCSYAESFACDSIDVLKKAEWLSETEGLVLLRTAECKDEKFEQELYSLFPASLASYVAQLNTESQSEWKEFASYSSELQRDARLQRILKVKDLSSLRNMWKLWKKSGVNEWADYDIALAFYKAFSRFSDYKRMSHVARRIYQWRPSEHEAFLYANALFQSGKEKLAWQKIKKFRGMSRLPASVGAPQDLQSLYQRLIGSREYKRRKK